MFNESQILVLFVSDKFGKFCIKGSSVIYATRALSHYSKTWRVNIELRVAPKVCPRNRQYIDDRKVFAEYSYENASCSCSLRVLFRMVGHASKTKESFHRL